MSVINSVLKDLEARESGFTPIEIVSVEAAPAVRRERRPLMLAAVMALLLAAAAWFYLQLQTLPVVAASFAQPATEEQSAVVVTAGPGSAEERVAEPVPGAQQMAWQPQPMVEAAAVQNAATENPAPAGTRAPAETGQRAAG